MANKGMMLPLDAPNDTRLSQKGCFEGRGREGGTSRGASEEELVPQVRSHPVVPLLVGWEMELRLVSHLQTKLLVF